MPSNERYKPEGDTRLYDSDEGCYYIRERQAVTRLNNVIETIAMLVERNAVDTRSGLAIRIRAMKERL